MLLLLLALQTASPPPVSASAQATAVGDDPALSQRANDVLLSMGNALSSPELPATLPPAPERMELMREYLRVGGVDATLKTTGELIREKAQPQVSATLNALPTSQRPTFSHAVDAAFAQAEANREKRALDGAAAYYATRMSTEDLTTAVGFYTQGLGRKLLTDAKDFTADDRQVMGRFTLDHPAMVKFAKLNFDYTRHLLALRGTQTKEFDNEFKTSLCDRLKSTPTKLAACTITR